MKCWVPEKKALRNMGKRLRPGAGACGTGHMPKSCMRYRGMPSHRNRGKRLMPAFKCKWHGAHA